MAGTDLTVARAAPVADYTALDQPSLERLLTNFIQYKYPGTFTDLSNKALITSIVRLTAFACDQNAYMIDSHVRELFAATARRALNMKNIAKPFGYDTPSPESALVTLRLTLDPDPSRYPFTITQTDQFSNGSTVDEVFFQPINPLVVAAYPGLGYVDVECVEGELYQEVLILVSNAAASQRAQFPQNNVVLSSVVIEVANVTWARVTSWVGQGASAQVYRLDYDNAGHVFAIFGDGTFGAIPANGNRIVATFRVGGGTRGNLTSNPPAITTIVQADPAIQAVSNIVNSAGGQDFQSIKETRYAIPASISTLRRAVDEKDHEKLALTVAGVAKAFATKATEVGSRIVRLTVAPTGGGVPTQTLRNTLVTFFKTAKMVAGKVKVTSGFLYKDIIFSVLIHVNADFKASVVNEAVRQFFTNTQGTGQFDFAQLNPGAVDSDGQLLLSLTRLQGFFDHELKDVGVDRAIVGTFTIRPESTSNEANTGTGGIDNTSIVLNGLQKRREFHVVMLSASQYKVFERIIGYVTSLADNELTDDDRVDFNAESPTGVIGYKLVPSREGGTEADIIAATEHTLTVSGVSLFSLTSIGAEYYLYDKAGVVHVLGDTYVSSDGSVQFSVVAGLTAFVAGDTFSLDVFPQIGDVQLRGGEYPQLALADFTTRTTGGKKV